MDIRLINYFSKLTIKSKITILFFITNLGILILFSGFILLRSYFLIYGAIDRSLETITNELIKSIEKKSILPAEIKFCGNKYWIKIYNNNKKVIFTSQLAKKVRKIPDFFQFFGTTKKFSYDIRLKGKNYLFLSPDKYAHVEFRVLIKKFKNGYIQIAYPIEQTEESFQNLLGVVAWAIAIFVLLIAIIGYYFSYKTLSPINQIIKQANYISEKNLNIRLPVINKDEIGKLGETLNELFSRLEIAFSKQKEFSANVSHELKTPLSMIKLSLENIINNNNITEELKIELKKVITNIQRMQNLISKLLLLSKIEYMKNNPELIDSFKNINLTQIIKNTLSEFEEYFKSKDIILKKNFPEEKILIKGDKELIEKLFFNLFLNAFNFTQTAGKIEVTLIKDENYIIFKIKNSGMGIPYNKLKNIFNRFYRIDRSRSRDTGGSGLGLAICKAIVEIHKGEIQAISKINEYTQFIVRLKII